MDHVTTPCAEAPGCRSVDGGYGFATYEGKQQYAHRVAWQRAHGPIPPGLSVLHHCDNPPCINVEHLFLGTQRDNIEDMVAKGRGNAKRKMTSEQVAAARARYAGGESQSAIARDLGVHPSNICLIVKGRTWKGR